jgi:hypothetical protein
MNQINNMQLFIQNKEFNIVISTREKMTAAELLAKVENGFLSKLNYDCLDIIADSDQATTIHYCMFCGNQLSSFNNPTFRCDVCKKNILAEVELHFKKEGGLVETQ